MTKDNIKQVLISVINDFNNKWKGHDELFNGVDNYAKQIFESFNLRLSEQKEKHEQEMEEFNLFVSANFMYSFEEKKWYHNNFAQHNSVHYEKHYTFTELLTKFKNR